MTDLNSAHADLTDLWIDVLSDQKVLNPVMAPTMAVEQCGRLGAHAWALTTVLGHFGDDEEECVQARQLIGDIDALVTAFDVSRLLSFSNAYRAAAEAFMFDGF